AVIVAVVFGNPASECRSLIIKKDAAILYLGSILLKCTLGDVQTLLLLDWNIGPPVPRRHTDLLGKVKDSVAGAAPIAASDNHSAADARLRIPNQFNMISIPLVSDITSLHFTLSN